MADTEPSVWCVLMGIRDKGLALLLLMLSLLIISLSICFLAHQHKTYTELLGGQ